MEKGKTKRELLKEALNGKITTEELKNVPIEEVSDLEKWINERVAKNGDIKIHEWVEDQIKDKDAEQ